MKYVKKIVGELCYLSPVSLEDVDLYLQWINDLETAQYLQLFYRNNTRESELEILKKVSREHVYGIIDKQKDILIGNCGLVEIDRHNMTANTGIFIGRKEYLGRGYGTEAMRLLVDYGFQYLNLQNIMLNVYEDNPRAIASYKKVGFKVMGVRRKARIFKRRTLDIIFMDIIPEDLYGGD
jgi:RimJ/RimL family protein N-acetyltransferase